MANSFLISCEVEIKMKHPKLNVTDHIFAPFHITNQKSNKNLKFGLNLLWEHGIYLDFQNNYASWKENKKPMKSIDCEMKIYFAIQDGRHI